MEIETVPDLANKIADWLGVYGACKEGDKYEPCCEKSEKDIFCCRVGFCMHMEERIREAVGNENKLDDIHLK